MKGHTDDVRTATRNSEQGVVAMIKSMLLSLLLCFALTGTASAASDFRWTFGNNGFSDYRLDAVSSSEVYGGLPGATDPTLILTVGKRYEVTVSNSGTHPFQVLAKGGSSISDIVLLSQAGVSGSFETDSGSTGWMTSRVQTVWSSSRLRRLL